jgi:hypothetical protein
LVRRIRDWLRERRLNSQRRQLIVSYDTKLRRELHGAASSEEIAELRQEEEELENIDKGMAILGLLKLRSRAAGLGLYVDWNLPELDGDEWLGPIKKEMSELRTAIRKERYDRLQLWEMRVKLVIPVVTALTGLAGVAIGLIAIWRR